MKFTLSRDELPKVSILEFNGEFEQLDKLKMDIQEDRIIFNTSFIKSGKKSSSNNLILRAHNGVITPHAMCTDHILFDTPPKYINNCKRG
ncbi:hypothetical protein NEIG_00953 [Nematocida sp. ERTm5]|nr:hypothetical protein NEIG_00953 [Nematocida sp. ERTm5]